MLDTQMKDNPKERQELIIPNISIVEFTRMKLKF